MIRQRSWSKGDDRAMMQLSTTALLPIAPMTPRRARANNHTESGTTSSQSSPIAASRPRGVRRMKKRSPKESSFDDRVDALDAHSPFIESAINQGCAERSRVSDSTTKKWMRKICCGCGFRRAERSSPSRPCPMALLAHESLTDLPTLEDTSAVPTSSAGKPRLFHVPALFRPFRGKRLSTNF